MRKYKQAIEILKKKPRIQITLIQMSDTFEQYNRFIPFGTQELTKDEFKILKEVFI